MLLLWLVYPSDKTGKFLSLICRFAWLKACTPSETMAFRYPLQLVADSAKTPSDGTLLRRKSRRFCDVGCCSSFIAVFVMLVVVIFMFPGYFSMLPTLHLGFSGPRRPPPALSSIPWLLSFALLFRHIFTARATVLSGYF